MKDVRNEEVLDRCPNSSSCCGARASRSSSTATTSGRIGAVIRCLRAVRTVRVAAAGPGLERVAVKAGITISVANGITRPGDPPSLLSEKPRRISGAFCNENPAAMRGSKLLPRRNPWHRQATAIPAERRGVDLDAEAVLAVDRGRPHGADRHLRDVLSSLTDRPFFPQLSTGVVIGAGSTARSSEQLVSEGVADATLANKKPSLSRRVQEALRF